MEENIKKIYEVIPQSYLFDIGLSGLNEQNPILIGDVLDWIEATDKKYSIDRVYIVDIWKHKRLPIEDQPEECIDYIHSLIQQD